MDVKDFEDELNGSCACGDVAEGVCRDCGRQACHACLADGNGLCLPCQAEASEPDVDVEAAPRPLGWWEEVGIDPDEEEV